MLVYIADFEAYRVRLHQALSMQVASGVSDLVTKMDALLSRLFAPKAPWEIDTARRLDAIRTSDANHQWITDPQALQALVLATGDSEMSFSTSPDSSQDAMAPMMHTRMDLQYERLKEDLQLSLDDLCKKNRDLFNLQLRLYAERLEQAIMISARMVIRTLEGPHDRLENEVCPSIPDNETTHMKILRPGFTQFVERNGTRNVHQLKHHYAQIYSKNWFFCVETKIFSIAIFEYYLDLYSTPPMSRDAPSGTESVAAAANSAHAPSSYPYMPRSNAAGQFKSGSLSHPEAWTLNYLLLFNSKIAPLIDTDGSGFIRISEANAFTANIPFEWTIPQWCAYLVEGVQCFV